jgi:alkyldihydroxyacetonephosphate synthase
MTRHDAFEPRWITEPPPHRSFRSLFKWGAPAEFKNPNRRLYALMKRTFGMTDEDFGAPVRPGFDQVPEGAHPPRLPPAQREALATIVGAENASADLYTRLESAYGKTMVDLMRLREGIVENVPDLVLRPRSRADLRAVVDYCDRNRIPIYVRGGGSSVTRGFEAVRGGVTLDMRAHLKRVLRFDEQNQTITVEAGISGPDLERLLNDAPRTLGAKHRYTCGHQPQSFEFTAVGGWVVTRGAGQSSTYYGKIEEMVVAQDYVCPSCDLATQEFPAAATGPDTDQVMIGSEGAFGILYSATLRVRRYRPQNTRRYSFIFRSWSEATQACREVMQGEFGFPCVFRLSDPEETDVALKLYGVEGTPIDALMRLRGYRQGERCLLVGTAEGERDFARLVARKVARTCRAHGAMSTTGFVTRAWEHGRFRDPYLRDALQDFGVVTDTLECSVSWANLEKVHAGVRAFCHSRPQTICMTHASHFYPQGCNLYFIFIGRMGSLDEYRAYQAGILDAIQASGATMSHHHGIGKMTAPWLEGQIGAAQLGLFRQLKAYFDPHGVMNPGGTLALDLPDSERRFPAVPDSGPRGPTP